MNSCRSPWISTLFLGKLKAIQFCLGQSVLLCQNPTLSLAHKTLPTYLILGLKKGKMKKVDWTNCTTRFINNYLKTKYFETSLLIFIPHNVIFSLSNFIMALISIWQQSHVQNQLREFSFKLWLLNFLRFRLESGVLIWYDELTTCSNNVTNPNQEAGIYCLHRFSWKPALL